MKTSQIQEIISIFEASTIAKMELEIADMKIKLEKQPSSHVRMKEDSVEAPVITKQVEHEVIEEEKGEWIKSPIVGTFYSSRSKGGAPFVEIGQAVKKGDVLCIIEAMKVMNEIHSPVDGIVRSILPTNESMVEFNQDLIRIGE